MSQDNPLDLVKHGDPQAIAALLNKILNPRKISVTVNQQQDCLEIALESDPVVPQEKAIAFIQKCFLKYEVTAILQVIVYGKKTGKDFPIWDAEFSWGDNAVNLDSDIGLGDESAKDQAIHESQDGLHTSGDIIEGRYRILHILGQGGNGITYAAEDLENGSKVAIKALSLRNAGQWKQMELFEREAKVLAQLDHPQIPKYLNYFTVDTAEDRAFYIVQGLAEGKNLAQMVENGWRTNEAEAKRIAEQVLSILIYLHDLNPPVVHRDVKPQNLIYQSGGQVSLVDFGAVQDVYQSTMARGSTVVGTFGYMAPEQFIGQAVPATDLYALGATLLFVLTHRSPSEIPQERLRFNFRSRMQVSDSFATWLQKILEPDLESRYESAKQALAELKKPKQSSPNKRSLSLKKFAILLVAGITATAIFNSQKWAILNAVNIYPCYLARLEESTPNDYKNYPKGYKDYQDRFDLDGKKLVELKDYLKSGGKSDLLQTDNSIDRQCQAPIAKSLVRTVIKYKDTEAIDLLIKNYDIKSKNITDTLLSEAIYSNEATVVELLINKGIEIDLKNTNSRGDTLLHRAINSYNFASYENKIATIKLLLSKGTDIYAKDNQGKTPLHDAIDFYNQYFYDSYNSDYNRNTVNVTLRTGIVKLLVSKGADIYAKDNQGKSPLDYARTDEIMKELLQSKDANRQVQNLLAKAVKDKNQILAYSLINNGADINAKDIQGKTLLDYAIENKDIDETIFIIFELEGGNETEIFDRAVKRGDINTAEFLVKANVKWRGSTSLHEAVLSKDLNKAELLIKQGADVNARDKRNATPLHNAVYRRDKNMSELLLKNNADINAKGFNELSPLHRAVSRGDIDMVEFLISKGANINARDNKGKTPLYESPNQEIANLLVSKGANVNAKDNTGYTFLHYAANEDFNNINRVAFILSKGADVNARDNQGFTPLIYAKSNEMRQFLKSKGAK